MTSWKTYRLGDIADIQTGPFGSQLHNKDYADEGSPIVTVEHLGNRHFTTQNLPLVSDTDKARLSKYILSEGDIVFSRVGSVDRCSYVSKAEDGWMFSGRCLRVRCSSKAYPLYVYYYFCLESIKQYIRNVAVGATMPSINTQIMSEIPISLPSLEEQRRIAGILGAIDDKIENNRRINTNLELQAQALYKQWFVDNRSDDWEEKPLSEIVFFQEGPGIRNWQYVEKKGVRFINIRCINDGDVNVQNANMISEDEACGKYAHFLLEPLDIVMSCSGTLGRYAIIRQEHLPLCLNTSVIRFRPTQCIEDYSFVYGYLSSAEFLNKQEEMACGSVQANFGPTHLKQIKIKVPPKDYRMKYNNVVMPIINTMLKNRSEINMLSSLRDTLLPKLMNGEIKV